MTAISSGVCLIWMGDRWHSVNEMLATLRSFGRRSPTDPHIIIHKSSNYVGASHFKWGKAGVQFPQHANSKHEGTEHLTAALLDRLTHRAHMLYKIRAALKRTAGQWQRRMDIPNDGIKCTNHMHRGRRLNHLEMIG